VRNLPNVQVDQKGNVSIAGKKSVTIWLDGKPSTMAEVDVAAFLKSIPASSIESIEVITNPSARYDAEGTGGIIHVHLKKTNAMD
jgi:outer membrane receptor for ferrienterochelin and colicin